MFLCEELNSNPLGGKKPSPLADIYHYEQEDYVCPTAVSSYTDWSCPVRNKYSKMGVVRWEWLANGERAVQIDWCQPVCSLCPW